MILTKLAACLLTGLLGAGPGQESEPGRESAQEKPAQPVRQPLQSLVKLPADFVQYARVPEAGLRPRLGHGRNGLAVIYSTGGEAQGDLYLTQSQDEAKTFSASQRVNPTPGTVLSWNQTQSGSIDVGSDDRVHVAWISGGEMPALHYVRTTPAGELEPPLDLGSPADLGTTTAVTVDEAGQVYLLYSAGDAAPDARGDPAVRIWLRRSTDGRTFTAPVAIDPNLNVSFHSDIAAHVDEVMGTVFVLYRTGYQVKETSPIVSRTLRLLSSEDRGEHFDTSIVDNWKRQRDPHASAHLSQEKNSTLVAWDMDGDVCWSVIRRQLNQVNLPVAAKGERAEGTTRNHAAGAAGGNEVIVTWLERPEKDPQAPARLGWQVWLREGRHALGNGNAPEPATAGGQVVFPRKAGGFTILY